MWRKTSSTTKRLLKQEKTRKKKDYCGHSIGEYDKKATSIYFRFRCGNKKNYEKFLSEADVEPVADEKPVTDKKSKYKFGKKKNFKLDGTETKYYCAIPNGWEQIDTEDFERALKEPTEDDFNIEEHDGKIYIRKDGMLSRVVKLPYLVDSVKYDGY